MAQATPNQSQEADEIASRDAWRRIVQAAAEGMADGEAGNPFAEGAAAALPGIHAQRQRDANRFDELVPSYRDGRAVDYGGRAPIGNYRSRMKSLGDDHAEVAGRALEARRMNETPARDGEAIGAPGGGVVDESPQARARWRSGGDEGKWSDELGQMRGMMASLPMAKQIEFMGGLKAEAPANGSSASTQWMDWMPGGANWGAA